MPIYEYKCPSCQHTFEAIRKMAEADDPISCPACRQQVSNRMISVCNAISEGQSLTHSGSSCSGCTSGNCGSCGH
ncbi:MAG: zinc ribbon domain-containing protein [Chloroflexi bacterium]|nr:zinc ribbon domain-containing protein [Chloroflexota bacterium]